MKRSVAVFVPQSAVVGDFGYSLVTRPPLSTRRCGPESGRALGSGFVLK